MRIFIITMDDPIQTRDFIKRIIDNREKDIIGVAVTKGNRLTISKKRSKVIYLFSLLLIMGAIPFLRNSLITLIDKVKKLLSKYKIVEDPSILNYAKSKKIAVWNLNTLNSTDFLSMLSSLNVDLIVNQSQSIIKTELIKIPRIGIINRHNALLPKNRGRLTPFWVLFKNEQETGVSIHFVTEQIDAGDIIVQEKYPILKNDTFNSLVRKNYEIAPKAMLKAIDLLEKGNYMTIKNDANQASYNTIPTFSEALKYRINRINFWR